MPKKTYTDENELSFTITYDLYTQIMTQTDPQSNLPILCAYSSDIITQYWLTSANLKGGACRTRLRNTRSYDGAKSKINPTFTYEYTTKYYWDDGSRTEINASITEKEFDHILTQYAVNPEIKTRIYIEDTQTGYIYTADLHDNQTVTIEIEFATDEDKRSYKMPKWLIYAVKQAKMAENPNPTKTTKATHTTVTTKRSDMEPAASASTITTKSRKSPKPSGSIDGGEAQ